MAKRFTDTNKWKDTWFQDLPNKYKLFWIYLLDECDAAGLWKPNMRLAQFQIGEPFEEIELKRVFTDRILITDEGYWFVSKFIDFQYGELSEKSKPHMSILRLLEKHNIKGYPKGIHTLKEKEKEKDKEKESVYLEPSEAFDDWKNDSLYIEELQRIFLAWNIKATEQTVAKAIKKFLLIEFKPGADRTDLKSHCKRWINRNTKDFA